MPISAIAATTAGLIVVGRRGAGRADDDAVAGVVGESAAAIWERPALWTQTNRTSGVDVVRHRAVSESVRG